MKVLAASVLATVKLEFGSVIVLAAVGQAKVICCPNIGRIDVAFGRVIVASPAIVQF